MKTQHSHQKINTFPKNILISGNLVFLHCQQGTVKRSVQPCVRCIRGVKLKQRTSPFPFGRKVRKGWGDLAALLSPGLLPWEWAGSLTFKLQKETRPSARKLSQSGYPWEMAASKLLLIKQAVSRGLKSIILFFFLIYDSKPAEIKMRRGKNKKL